PLPLPLALPSPSSRRPPHLTARSAAPCPRTSRSVQRWQPSLVPAQRPLVGWPSAADRNPGPGWLDLAIPFSAVPPRLSDRGLGSFVWPQCAEIENTDQSPEGYRHGCRSLPPERSKGSREASGGRAKTDRTPPPKSLPWRTKGMMGRLCPY